MQEAKSIKEIAEQLQTSKTTIQKLLKANKIGADVIGKRSQQLFYQEKIDLITELFNKQTYSQPKTENQFSPIFDKPKFPETTENIYTDIIKTLEAQLHEKDMQIEQLNSRLQEALYLSTAAQNRLLEITANSEAKPQQEKKEKGGGWFSKLFG